jgi:hypothetical protein
VFLAEVKRLDNYGLELESYGKKLEKKLAMF